MRPSLPGSAWRVKPLIKALNWTSLRGPDIPTTPAFIDSANRKAQTAQWAKAKQKRSDLRQAGLVLRAELLKLERSGYPDPPGDLLRSPARSVGGAGTAGAPGLAHVGLSAKLQHRRAGLVAQGQGSRSGQPVSAGLMGPPISTRTGLRRGRRPLGRTTSRLPRDADRDDRSSGGGGGFERRCRCGRG